MLELQDISKSYEELKALNGVSFTLRAGEVVGLLGPNGAGKSTLMKILTGYIKNWHGSIRYGTNDLREKTKAIQQVTGYLPENNPLYPDLFVLEYLEFIASIYGIQQPPCATVIDKVGLNEVKNRKVSTLSKGYQQRVGFAAALLHDPEILIMDDPTAFMDAESYRQTWDMLLRMKGEKTILYVSQSLKEVEDAHDRILVLEDGKISLDGSLDKLLGGTFEFHQFQIEFENLPDDLFQKLSKLPKVKNASKIGQSIHFYGRERGVFFDVLKNAVSATMKDISVKKLGLQDLMDAKYAKDGIH